MIHTSVSCLLGLGYGCGYICSIASYEIAGKYKKKEKEKKEKENKEKENKEKENNSDNQKEIKSEFTVSELVSTLEAVKIELKEMKINLESVDNKIDKIDKTDNQRKSKMRTRSF
tara:strand:- start:71 stop:415 length:345 start_codon:yes stop_codon:yes gene_type:complete